MRTADHNSTTTRTDSIAEVMLNGRTWIASFGERSPLRYRPRIADDPVALAAAGELLNQGVVVEMHPLDVPAAIDAGLALARAELDANGGPA